MHKISVVVPVYNMEKYLNRCINSILNQTYENIEIILVNDGSVDKSSQICDEYSIKFSNVKVIHKENGGISTARNAGIKVATGDFIGFVDSDDWISSDMYEVLYSNLIKTKSDISMCNRIKISNENNKFSLTKEELHTIIQGDDVLKTFLRNDMLAVWNKLFRKELIYDLTFPIGKIHEDIFFSFKAMERSKAIVLTNDQLYFYFTGNESITRSFLKMEDFNMLDEWNKVLNECVVNYKEMRNDVIVRKNISYLNLINKYIMYGPKEDGVKYILKSCIPSWTEEIKNNIHVIRDSPYINFNRRVQIEILRTSYVLFYVMKKISRLFR